MSEWTLLTAQVGGLTFSPALLQQLSRLAADAQECSVGGSETRRTASSLKAELLVGTTLSRCGRPAQGLAHLQRPAPHDKRASGAAPHNERHHQRREHDAAGGGEGRSRQRLRRHRLSLHRRRRRPPMSWQTTSCVARPLLSRPRARATAKSSLRRCMRAAARCCACSTRSSRCRLRTWQRTCSLLLWVETTLRCNAWRGRCPRPASRRPQCRWWRALGVRCATMRATLSAAS